MEGSIKLYSDPLSCHAPLGMDTGVVEKDSKSDYRPGFMQHFDKKDEQKKKVGRKQGPQGPHDISYYFPDIPDGMDFRDFVSRVLFLTEPPYLPPLLAGQLKTLTQPQLEEYMSALDRHMDQELESLRKRYHQKRLPILQAMDAKKKQFRN